MGHLKNHHEDHVDIRKIKVEALSNPHATFCINKLVYKEKDESLKPSSESVSSMFIENVRQNFFFNYGLLGSQTLIFH